MTRYYDWQKTMSYQTGTNGEICIVIGAKDIGKTFGLRLKCIERFIKAGEILDIEDHLGNTYRVIEPAALALYPMSKTVNDTGNDENRTNMIYAKRNRPSVNTTRKIITEKGVIDFSEVSFYD